MDQVQKPTELQKPKEISFSPETNKFLFSLVQQMRAAASHKDWERLRALYLAGMQEIRGELQRIVRENPMRIRDASDFFRANSKDFARMYSDLLPKQISPFLDAHERAASGEPAA